jgi:DNA repair photolyase
MPIEILAKTILNKTKKRDTWFLDDYTLNPYSACSFNCLYCYIRGSKYGEHMEDKLAIKTNAVELLEKQLKNKAKKGQYGFIVVSSATDPYLQIEKETHLTRQLLEVIAHYRFPVHIITKSDLVVRDFDILKKINENSILPADLEPKLAHKALITFSFSTIDPAIGKIFEPGAPSPEVRLGALKQATQAGFHSGVSMMPLLPYITDTDEQLESMYSAFKSAAAKYVFPASMTLFGNGNSDSKPLMMRAISKHYPDLLSKYEKLFQYGFQPLTWYRDQVAKKTTAMNLKFEIPDRIIPALEFNS